MAMIVVVCSLGLTLVAALWVLFHILRGSSRRHPNGGCASNEILAGLAAQSQTCMDPALLTDASGMILHASESALARLGYSASRLQGTRLADLAVSSETLEVSWRLMRILTRQPHEFRIELKRGDGPTLAMAATVTKLSETGSGLYLVTLSQTEAGVKKCLPCATGERLRTLLDHNPSAIFEADAEGRLTYCNTKFVELHQLQGRRPGSLLDSIHHEHREFVATLWREAVRENREFATEHRVLDSGLDERWVMLRARPLKSPAGEIRMAGNACDATSMHHALTSAQQKASLMDSIVHATPVPIIAFDTEARVRLWNPAAQALFGFSEQEVLGRGNPLLEDDDHEQFEQLFARVLNGEVLVGKRVTRRAMDGRRVDISLYSTPIRDKDGQVAGVASCLMDVTEQVAAEREMWMRAQDLRRSQEIANLGSWHFTFEPGSTAMDGELKWSSQTYRIFGVDEQSFVVSMSSFLDMVHPDDRQSLLAASRRAVAKGIEYQFEHRIVRPDGATRIVCERARIDRDSGGRWIHMVGTIQDVTDQRSLEQRLAQADRMEGIGRLAGGVAHDFNNLLTVINGYCDLLLETDALRESELKPVREIRKAGARAAELTNQMLTFSRRQVTQPRLIDLNAAVRESAAMLGRLLGEDVKLELALTGAPIRIWIDPTQINQILMNLAINARDAMPWGGRLIIRTGVSAGPEGPSKGAPGKARFAVLEVEDSGEGMEASVLKHIFEPFFTTKSEGKGTGLGLSMVYAIVEQAGGQIQVSSEVGQGSRFTVYLPEGGVEEDSPSPLTPVRSEIKGGNETVLIVEDQPDVLEIASLALRGKGYRILEAQTPGEAISVCENYQGPIDLILSDIVLPGMSGLELSRVLAAKRPMTGLVFMSGYAREAIAQRGILPAETEYMPKPFTLHEIQSRIRRVLDATQAAREAQTTR